MDDTLLNGRYNPESWISLIIEKQRLSRAQNSMSKKDEMLATQFLEYASTHLAVLSDANLPMIYSILKEVNEILSDKVFLVGHQRTYVDVIYYNMIHPAMSKLPISDKETFVHVSRWFNHLQSDDSVRQLKPIVAFNRTLIFV